jgi:uncharacterized repeat protein (TIGR01451 family)/LPXTG-motif cell wall-anchored protein
MSRRLAFAGLSACCAASLGLWMSAAPAFAGVTFDLSISKSHTGNFTVGTDGTFTITVHNGGPSATGSDTITVTDTLPTGLTYASDTGSSASLTCNASGQTVTCSGAPGIANGADATFTLTVHVADAARPSATNSVTVSESFSADNNPDNDTDTDTVTVDAGASATPTPAPTSTSPTPAPVTSHSPSHSPTPAVAGTNNELPDTGFPAGTWLLVAGGVIVVGLGAFGISRVGHRAH